MHSSGAHHHASTHAIREPRDPRSRQNDSFLSLCVSAVLCSEYSYGHTPVVFYVQFSICLPSVYYPCGCVCCFLHLTRITTVCVAAAEFTVAAAEFVAILSAVSRRRQAELTHETAVAPCYTHSTCRANADTVTAVVCCALLQAVDSTKIT